MLLKDFLNYKPNVETNAFHVVHVGNGEYAVGKGIVSDPTGELFNEGGEGITWGGQPLFESFANIDSAGTEFVANGDYIYLEATHEDQLEEKMGVQMPIQSIELKHGPWASSTSTTKVQVLYRASRFSQGGVEIERKGQIFKSDVFFLPLGEKEEEEEDSGGVVVIPPFDPGEDPEPPEDPDDPPPGAGFHKQSVIVDFSLDVNIENNTIILYLQKKHTELYYYGVPSTVINGPMLKPAVRLPEACKATPGA